MSDGFLLPNWFLFSCFASTFLREPWSIENSITLDCTVILCLPTKPNLTVGGLNGLFGVHFDSCGGLLMRGVTPVLLSWCVCMKIIAWCPCCFFFYYWMSTWTWVTAMVLINYSVLYKADIKNQILKFSMRKYDLLWMLWECFLSLSVVYFISVWLYSLHRWLIEWVAGGSLHKKNLNAKHCNKLASS